MQMDFQVIFIAGPQGSGKGTQGKKLADKLGFLFFGMGDILREIVVADQRFADEIAAISRGTLLPDEIIIEILKERLALVPDGQGVIFDGVPRRVGQAEFILKYLRDRGRTKMATIFVDTPRELCMERLLSRAQSEGRSDDTPGAIQTRFRYYDEVIVPTIEYLKHQTTFFAIDGRPSTEEVERNINAALGL